MNSLETADWVVIALYFSIIAAVGWALSGRQRNTQDYFLGGRDLPWWAATLSIIATETSAVTYIGVPALAFRSDWSVLQLIVGFVLGRVFLALVFVRVFYRREYLTVYSYLAERYGEKSRHLSAVLFLLGRLIASGVRLFGGCLAFHIATGIEVPWLVVGLGAFGTLLTYTGGIKTVVWTDVILGFTLVAGGALAIFFIQSEIPGGWIGLFETAIADDKTKIYHGVFGSIADNKSLVAGLLGGFVLTLATHGTDQDIAQRMLTCRDARSGALSVLGSAVLILPVFTLFLAIGTALYVYHQTGTPSYEVPEKLNYLFPTYIVRELPAGVSGFVIAGLLAAALSSFTSALNALASTAITDFYRPLSPHKEEEHYLRASKFATLCLAVLLVFIALAFQGGDQVFQLSLNVFAYFYGALLGPFLLGMLTRRGTDLSVITGMLLSVPVMLFLQAREFIAHPENAPTIVREALQHVPQFIEDALLSAPDIGSRYWIVIGTAISMGVAALRSSPAKN